MRMETYGILLLCRRPEGTGILRHARCSWPDASLHICLLLARPTRCFRLPPDPQSSLATGEAGICLRLHPRLRCHVPPYPSRTAPLRTSATCSLRRTLLLSCTYDASDPEPWTGRTGNSPGGICRLVGSENCRLSPFLLKGRSEERHPAGSGSCPCRIVTSKALASQKKRHHQRQEEILCLRSEELAAGL